MQPIPSFVSPLFQDLPFIEAFLVKRVPGMKFHTDRQEALQAQLPFFKQIVRELLPTANAFLCAQEVHGSEIATITRDKISGLARIFHTDRDEARQTSILTQGCMSTYCSSQNRSLTQHSLGFPASAVDRHEIFGLARIFHTE